MKFKHKDLGATLYPSTKILAFYGGIFSQWAECQINLSCLDLPTVNCAEQGMMLLKARTFKDDDAFDAILKAKNPSNQKAIGRTIKNFDPKVWDKVALDYVTTINYEKFIQNPVWRIRLESSHEYTIVEASPTDKIWGVGMHEDDPDIADKSKWKGKNLLGIAIMAARSKILDINPPLFK